MDAIGVNVFISVLTAGAWGTKTGFGWGATLAAWFLILLVVGGAIALVWKWVKNLGEDTPKRTKIEHEKLMASEDATTKRGKKLYKAYSEIVDRETQPPHHDH